MNFNSGVCTIKKDTEFLSKNQIASIFSQITKLCAENNCALTRFEESLFSSAAQLQTVDLYNCNKLTIISKLVFYKCTKLTTVILPEHGVLETISGGAFTETAITKHRTVFSMFKFTNS